MLRIRSISMDLSPLKILYGQGPRSKFSSGGAKEESVKENFLGGGPGGAGGGMLVDFYSISLK